VTSGFPVQQSWVAVSKLGTLEGARGRGSLVW